MKAEVEIPYGGYWSTPFCRWQNEFQNLHSLKFAGYVAKSELEGRKIPGDFFDSLILATTIPQTHSFYGAPWVASMAGLGSISGPTISQACASGVRSIATALGEMELGLGHSALIISADRTSNGANLYYPNSQGVGGGGENENWVLDNFSFDPAGSNAMIDTAENVARKHNISLDEQHDVVAMRSDQYQKGLMDNSKFHRRFMRIPFTVPDSRFRKIVCEIESDIGIIPSTAESLSDLRPVLKGGSVTFAGQTHPADGNASLIITTREKSEQISSDASICVKILGIGQSRVRQSYMPEAVAPAAISALKHANISIKSVDAIKTHNPFAVNDIVFSRETGVRLEKMNNYGCSLIWGHPQAPTGIRSIIELIEELVAKGGGIGVFSGCAAGDTAMAVCLSVTSR
ncbi:MAG: thiolase family protein [Gammaproteobacteria bacterium]|tara:strand:+ start:3076 stop:4281 length:1206 start_codon:yes stop_codon:yes gene_type:complete